MPRPSLLPAADPALWGSPRGAGNRSHLDARVTGVTRETAGIETGAHVRHVRRCAVRGRDQLLLHLGSIVRAVGLDGDQVWSRTDLGVSRVVGYTEAANALVVVSRRCVLVVLDAGTGETVWEFTTPESRDLTGVGSVRVVESGGRAVLLISPNYSTVVTCAELSDPGGVTIRWQHEFGTSIDAGFGPVLVVADALGLGYPQVVASSRVGASYDEDDGDVPTERLVLGRTDGQLYQVVLDLDDGTVLADVAYRPDSGPYPCARPYGLFEVIDGSDVVLVSCQVEEYVSVTSAPDLARRWGWFVERDWPVDEQELRPQSSSVAIVTDDGRPRLVVGHWDGATWSTLVLDVLGPAASGATTRIDGRYFWGTADLDGDGIAELIVSPEPHRRPAGTGTVEIVDARTGLATASMHDVRLVTTDDDELPAHRTFHAERRAAVVLHDDIVLVDTNGTTLLWNGERTRELWPKPVVRVDDRGGHVCLTDADGVVAPLDEDLAAIGTVFPGGRTPAVLLWSPGAPQVVVDTAGGFLEGWTDEPALAWRVPGDRGGLHIDAAGTPWLVAARSTGDGATVTAYRLEHGHPQVEWSVDVADRVEHVLAFGDDFTVFVGLRVAPHTTRAVMLAADGTELWHDPAKSAWASDPLAFRRDVRELVAYDDHGVLVVRDARSGELLHTDDWTAAYTTPIDLGDGMLRADGSHGAQGVAADGTRTWRANYDVFALHPGNSSVLISDERALLAAPRRDGVLDVLDAGTGTLVSSTTVGPQAERRPTIGLADTVLVGLASGILAAYTSTGDVAWTYDLGSAVESLAAVRHQERVVLAAGTADGRVRLLELAGA